MIPRSSRPSQQKGAAAIFAAFGMLAMVTALAFGVDLAQMFLAKRELQNMANLAASSLKFSFVQFRTITSHRCV